jgi:putative salt-induced outer membrane protein YdiY
MHIVRRIRWVNAILLAGLAFAPRFAVAADDSPAPADTAAAADTADEEKPPSRWSNSTELSLVVTEGNSTLQSFGLKNTLDYKANRGRARFRLDALRSDTSDDPYLLVVPGIIFQPGETVAVYSTTAVRPAATPDVSRFFTEGRYEGDLKKKATWNAGASWDMDEDAGILSRTIVFGGLGHSWRDRDDLKFRTTYGLSWTDRVEEVDDPEKEQTFLGARVSSFYKDTWGKAAIYENNFTLNVSLSDFSDYNADLTQSVSVNVSKHLALKVSLQLTYAGEPALEEVDVIARAILIDPDGIPGTGDEYFETVETGGVEIVIGEDTLRREALDTTFRTSLQISY